MNSKLVFSPQQVYVGSFLGGPLAGVYLLKKNFSVMGNSSRESLVAILGAAFLIVLTIGLIYIPENFPNMLLPITYSAVAAGIAYQWQVTKEEVEVSEEYQFTSYWAVAKVAVISLVVYFPILFGVLLGLAELGFIELV